METKDAGEEAMERNNCASQNSQRVVELKEENHVLKTQQVKLICLLRRLETNGRKCA